MIFDAKSQSFKILVAVCGLVGATFVADCQAERIPVSPVNQSYCLDLLGHEADGQLESLQQSRQQNEQQWTEFKQFVSEKSSTINQKLAGLNLQDWWQQSVANETPDETPSKINRTDSIAISPVAMLLRVAANITIVQYWQVGNQTADLITAGRGQIDQASLKLQDDFRSSLFQLLESTATNLNSIATAPSIIKLVSGSSSDGSDQMNVSSIATAANVNSDSTSDPYWGYYSDCDHWGAEFDNSDD